METATPRYSWTDPDAYEVFMGRWSERLARPFLSFAGITPGGRVLDVPAGQVYCRKRWPTLARV
jgi:hypothetical protein